jgi:prepilin-type N-terminal cleavage/methylation domain-containing protein/prepilin-type processing-associated H-X9-DG protein
MGVEDLKLWHWIVLGAVLGALVGYASTFAGPDRDPILRTPITAQQFVDLVNQEGTLHEIVIHPPRDGQNFVTAFVGEAGSRASIGFYAPIPFVADGVHAADVREFVQQAKAKHPSLESSYAFTEATWFIVLSRTIAGVILIGGVWPVLLNLMIGAGLGRKKLDDIDYDLDRFESEAKPSAPKVTAADLAQLNEVDHDLEENLSKPTTPETAAAASAQPVRQLNDAPLEPVAAPPPEEDKDYRGEFYPVAHPHHTPKNHGFSLVELIVVIGIIAILMAMLFPALKRVRQQALVTQCASNLHQISVALQNYLNENRNTVFWRADNINLDGMDWYAYGGRETANANLDQANFFNRIVPRPLNKYLSNKLEVYHCPCDDSAPWTNDLSFTIYFAPSQFDWVGNSYQYNANGYPLRPLPRHDGGLDGERFTSIKNTSQTVVFFDACLYYGYDWHYGHQANVAFADGHVTFMPLPPQNDQYRWNP